MPRYIFPPSHLISADRILSATSEQGAAIRQGPTPDAGNTGSLALYARHVHPDTTPSTLDLALEAGGNPEGYIAGGPTVTAGARLTWQLDGESSRERYWTDRPFVRYCDRPAHATGVFSHGRPSHLVQCPSGRAGFVAMKDTSPSDELVFLYKSSRLGDWTEVSIHGGGVSPDPELANAGHQPGLLITDAGRLIAYARVASPYTGSTENFVAAWYSDDEGATWTILNSAAAVLLNDSDVINAHWLQGVAVLVCGENAGAGVDCYHSTSDGVSFTASGTGNGTYYRPRTTVYEGTVLIHADDAAGDLFQASLSPGGQVDDDADWRGLLDVPTHAFGQQQRALCTDDQGALWMVTAWLGTVGAFLAYTSTDGGASWVQAGPATTNSQICGLDNSSAGSTNTLEGPQLGMLGADMVLLGRGQVATGTDGCIVALYLGGWSRTWSEETYGELAGDLYQFHYFPIDDPANLGWTQIDVGGGATVDMDEKGWHIGGAPTTATEYRAPGNWRTAMGTGGNGVRVRAVVNHTNLVAGNTTNSRCRIKVQLNASGAQWLELRFSRDKITAYDSTGVLASTGGLVGSEDFVGAVEYEIRLVKNGGTGGTVGAGTIWYRHIADGDTAAWSVLIDEVDVADDGGASGDDLRVGGDVAGNSDIYWMWLAMAVDPHGIRSGADARGRALSNTGAMYLYGGVAVGAYGTSGVAGDGYTLAEVAAFPKAAIWRTPSPAETCRSVDDSALWRVVFDAGADNLWNVDSVMLLGTNFRTCKLEANSSDSWGSPSQSTDLSAVIRSDARDAGEKGSVSLDTSDEMIPHEFASKPGARFFVHFSASGNSYVITDNSELSIYVEGVDLSSETGTVSVYADRMWGTVTTGTRYLAVTVAAQDTADGDFSLGYLAAGLRITMNAGDGSDAAWGWTRGTKIPVRVESAADGYESPTVLGGPQRMLMLPMLESMALVRPWHEEVDALVRYLDGPGSVVGVVLDSTESSMHNNGGLYRLTGTETKLVNVYGEMGNEERVKASALSFREVL